MKQLSQATLVKCKNPFRPTIGREISQIKTGRQIYTTLAENDLIRKKEGRIVRRSPFLVFHNGTPVMQKQWSTRLNQNDILEIVILPQGGGNDGGGSNIMQMVLMVALVVASSYVPGLMGFAAGTWQAAMVSAAIMVGGSLLMNALFPPPKLSALNNNRESVSPNYTLDAQNNTARLMESIPVLYGRFRLYPDMAAQPYTENRNNQQYLYQLLCITQGEIDLATLDLRIEDNSFASYGEIEYQIVQPFQPVTLFPDNVVSVAAVQNLALLAPGEPGYAVLGPFVVNAAGTTANALAVDVSLPAGVYTLTDAGDLNPSSVGWMFEYQRINDAGTPLGVWTAFENRTVTYATEQPQMLSFKVAVPEGRYQVRGQRLTPAPTSLRERNNVVWGSLRGYLTSTRTYGNVTLLAVIIRATNNLNSNTARRINVIATRKLPTWDPVDGWSSPVPTRSIAWAAADILRNTDYGRGLPTNRFNVEELHRLDAVWAARGDEFNGVFDTAQQLWEALTKVTRCGRTLPMYYAGMADFVRNEPRTIPSAMFQPSNMAANSFSTRYQFAEQNTPDHVVVEYIDGETWTNEQVECYLPGETTLTPSNQAFFGITNRDQAWREGMSMAAANRDQRRLISFTTGEEGLLVRFGDLIQISHDVPQWGFSGRVEWINTTSKLVKLTEPVTFAPGEDHVIAFRKKNGSADGPYPCIEVPDDPTLVELDITTSAAEDIYVSDGIRSEQTFYQFGPVGRAGLRALVHSGAPTSNGQVALTCVNYADSVHTAEGGGVIPPPPPASSLPRPPTLPIIPYITVQLSTVSGRQKIIVGPANNASYYEYEVSQNGTSWTQVSSTVETFVNVNLTPGLWYARARAVGVLAGPWETWSGNIEASVYPTPDVELFTATPQLFAIKLDWVLDPEYAQIAKLVEIWWGTTNILASATKLATLAHPTSSFPVYNLEGGDVKFFWIRVIDTGGRFGDWYNGGAPVAAAASTDAELILDQLAGEITSTQLSTELLETISTGGDAAVAVEALTDDLAAMYTIKTQLTVDDVPYMAGIGVGVENDDGIITSQILLAAERVAVLNEANGVVTTPFVISGGVVYMNSAFIEQASIGSAKFADWLESDALNSEGDPVLRMNFRTGEIQLNGSIGLGGKLSITNQRIEVYDASNVLRLRLGYLGV